LALNIKYSGREYFCKYEFHDAINKSAPIICSKTLFGKREDRTQLENDNVTRRIRSKFESYRNFLHAVDRIQLAYGTIQVSAHYMF
jgi:hypothetical protein